MSTLIRAIIFGSELVGFAVLCIVATIIFYNREEDRCSSREALKDNITYFIINFVILLAVFIFAYPTSVFLSYNKLILFTVFVISSSLIILLCLTRNKKIENILGFMSMIMFLFSMLMVVFVIFKNSFIENKKVISEQKETEIITPTMFSENQIGYTCDEDGNITTYLFYYQNNNVWTYKEISASDAKIEEITDKDTYIEETLIEVEYCNKEKKPSAEDYYSTETNTICKIYVNHDQMVEIKIN